MRSALLAGRDHTEIGAVELIAEGPCAISISRGGAAKTYSHTEPNEDACLFALGPGGALIAVADGHHGAAGAEIAMRQLLEQFAPSWTGEGPASRDTLVGEAAEALVEVNRAIVAEGERCKLPPSPTTLCFALVRPQEDLLLHVSVGDSHIFWTREAAPLDLGWAAQSGERAAFMGHFSAAEHAARHTIACESLAGTRSLVLVTDGFSEDGIGHDSPASELHTLQTRTLLAKDELRPVETCRAVAESALQIQRKNQAGDNLACATWTP